MEARETYLESNTRVFDSRSWGVFIELCLIKAQIKRLELQVGFQRSKWRKTPKGLHDPKIKLVPNITIILLRGSHTKLESWDQCDPFGCFLYLLANSISLMFSSSSLVNITYKDTIIYLSSLPQEGEETIEIRKHGVNFQVCILLFII